MRMKDVWGWQVVGIRKVGETREAVLRNYGGEVGVRVSEEEAGWLERTLAAGREAAEDQGGSLQSWFAMGAKPVGATFFSDDDGLQEFQVFVEWPNGKKSECWPSVVDALTLLSKYGPPLTREVGGLFSAFSAGRMREPRV